MLTCSNYCFKIESDYIYSKLMQRKYKIITALLVASHLLTFFIYSLKLKETDKVINPYPYIDISRNYIEQKNFIVNLQPLREDLYKIYDQYGEDRISLYIEFLNTGANISYNPDSRYYAASLIKLPYVVAAVKKIQLGEWTWDTELTMYFEDINLDYGKLGEQPIGSKFNLKTLIEATLIESDNTAFKMISRNMGYEPVNDFLKSTGLNEFFDKNQDITAKEYTRLIRALYTASYLSRENSQKILEIMGKSKRNYLGQGIPEDIIFSHKFGENIPRRIFSDSGVIYLEDRAFVVTVLFQAEESETQEHIQAFFKDVGATVYNYFSEYNK
mgnify:CR=1 FL=1